MRLTEAVENTSGLIFFEDFLTVLHMIDWDLVEVYLYDFMVIYSVLSLFCLKNILINA